MSAQPSHPADRGFGVNTQLTPNPADRPAPARGRRPRRQVENDDYTAFCRRIIKAAGARIAEGDVEGLPELLTLQVELDQAIAAAVTGLRDFGYSWGEIASRLGTSRQAAQQRWGNPTSGDSGGQ